VSHVRYGSLAGIPPAYQACLLSARKADLVMRVICGHPPVRVRDVTRPLELNLKVELVMGSSRTYKLWPSWRRKKDVNRSGAVVIELIWVASMVIMIAWQPAAPGCAIWPSGR
jgi:hypothetical protein